MNVGTSPARITQDRTGCLLVPLTEDEAIIVATLLGPTVGDAGQSLFSDLNEILCERGIDVTDVSDAYTDRMEEVDTDELLACARGITQ